MSIKLPYTIAVGDTQNQDKIQANFDALVNASTSTYIAPTLLNSWVNYGDTWNVAGYFKDSNNVVHIKGLVKNGTSAGAIILQLPVGYRPLAGMIFATESVDVICRLNVNSDGTVTLGTGGNTAYASINCSFLAEQ